MAKLSQINIWHVLILKTLLILFLVFKTLHLESMEDSTPSVLVVDFTQLRLDRALMFNAFESQQFEKSIELFQKIACERQENIDICEKIGNVDESFFTLHHNENVQDYIIGASSAFRVGTNTKILSHFEDTITYSKFILEKPESTFDEVVYKNIVFQYAMSQTILFNQDHTYLPDFQNYLDHLLLQSQDPVDFMKCVHIYTGLQDYAKILILDQKIRQLCPGLNSILAQSFHHQQSFMESIALSFFPQSVQKLREERLKIKTLRLFEALTPAQKLAKIETLRLNAKMLFEGKQYLSAFQNFQELHTAREFYCEHEQNIPESLNLNFLQNTHKELIDAYTCALVIGHYSFIQTTARKTIDTESFTLPEKKALLHRFAISTLIIGNIDQTLDLVAEILENHSLRDLIVCNYLYIGLGSKYNENIKEIEALIKDEMHKIKLDEAISIIKETNFFKEIITEKFRENNHKTSNTFKMVSAFYMYTKSLKLDHGVINIEKIWTMAFNRQKAYTCFQNENFQETINLLNQSLPILKGIKRNMHIPKEEGIDDFLEKLKLLIHEDERILQIAINSCSFVEWSDSEESVKASSNKKKKKKWKKKKKVQEESPIIEPSPTISMTEKAPQIEIPLKDLEALSISQEPQEKKKRTRTKPKKTKEEREQARAQRESELKEAAISIEEIASISSDDEDDGIIIITTPAHNLNKEEFDQKSSTALSLFFAQEYDEAAILFNYIMDSSLPNAAYTQRKSLRPYYAISNLYSKHKEKFFSEEKFFSPFEHKALAEIFERISFNYTHKDDYYTWKECLFMAGRSYVNAAQSSVAQHYQVSHYLTASRFFTSIQDVSNASKGYFSAAETIDISLAKNQNEAIYKTCLRRDLYLRAQAGFVYCHDQEYLEKITPILDIEFSSNPVAGFLEQNKVNAAKKRRYNELDFELVREKIEQDERKERETFIKRLREEEEKDTAMVNG